MAPETARVGFSDARSDIYALGVMFFEMLTGVVPFTGEAPVDVMMKQVNDRVPRMHEVARDAEITDETEQMIQKALSKDPEHRQQSMEEFHRDLQKCYGQLRFRRTLKTPMVHTPPVEVIALTKKKSPGALPGAIPSSVRSAHSVSIELETQAEAQRSGPPPAATNAATPTAPAPGGSAGTADAPILLTKKKAPRRDPGGTDPNAQQKTPAPDPVAPSSRGDKKRTTLPLGIEGAARVPGRIPPAPPTTSAYPSTPVKGAAAAPQLGAGADRPTPRVPMRTPADPTGADAPEGEQGWRDEPTVPGVSNGRH
jgi:serine/threonine protein kinase